MNRRTRLPAVSSSVFLPRADLAAKKTSFLITGEAA